MNIEDENIYVGNLDWDTIQNMEFEDPKEKEWAMWMALGCPEGWWEEEDIDVEYIDDYTHDEGLTQEQVKEILERKLRDDNNEVD